MAKIVIYGAGSFARMMRIYLDRVSNQEVVAFCVDREFLVNIQSIDGLPVLPFEDIEAVYPVEKYLMFVAIGYSNMRARGIMFGKAKSKKYRLVNYIDKSAVLDETVSIGENNVVLLGSTIEPFSSIGDNNIIWSSVTISHNVRVEDHNFFASKSLLGGHCLVENNCFFGFNSTCVQNIVVKAESLVGACSLVLSDTLEFSRNIGTPARVVSFHRKQGIFVE